MHDLRLLFFVAFGMLLFAASEAPAREPAKKCNQGVIIRFEGEINPGLEAYLFRKLDVAKERGADLVILEIDSPGGGLDESIRIAKRLQNLEWAHTVAYVSDKAISGAAIVSLGCDEILMAPHASLGDAGAIYLGEESLWHLAPQKMISFLGPTCAAWPKPKDVRRHWPRPCPTRISRFFMFAI